MRQKIDYLIDPIIKHGMERAKHQKDYGPYERMHVQEYNTVKVDLGRQSGHTSYMVRTAEQSDVIVTFNARETRRVRELVWAMNPCAPTLVVSADSFTPLCDAVYHKRDIDIVWIDTATYIKQSQIDVIYDALYKRAKLFVQLG